MEEHPPSQYTEYPRLPIEPRIRMETIAEAWKYLTAAPGQWIAATFLMMLLSLALAGPFYALGVMQLLANREPDIGNILALYAFIFLAAILAYVGQAIAFGGMYHMALKQIQGEAVTLKDMFSLGGSSVFSHIVVGFVISMGVMIGSIACYLPAFLIGGLLMFSQPILIHQKIGPMAALSQSWNLLKGQIWMAAAFYLVISLVASLGAIVCGVGMLFTYPLYPLAVSLIYRDYMQALYGQ